MRPRADVAGMRCPCCAAEIATTATSCELCLVALRREGDRLVAVFPEIRPGEPLDVRDLGSDPPPGQTQRSGSMGNSTFKPAEGGIETWCPADRSMVFREPATRVRDACLSVVGAALDPEVSIAAWLRSERIHDATTGYVLGIRPDTRELHVSRTFTSPDMASSTRFVPWTPSQAVAPVGQWNVLDFRVQGPTLRAFVNQQLVATIHDPVLGIGAAAMVVGAHSAAGRAFFRSYHLWLVAP